MYALIDNNLQQTIFKLLYPNQSLSIADISKMLKKSVPNITKVVNELLANQYIEEDGLAPSTGGRRAISYKISAQLPEYIIAISVDQYYTAAAVMSLQNELILSPVTVENQLEDQENSFEKIRVLIENFLKEEALAEKNCIGIGISMPGFVDYQGGTNGSYAKDSKFFDIKSILEGEFKIPVSLENDSAVIAMAEHRLGAAKGSKNALIINMNWGVGLGMIIDNKLFRGNSGFAGEFSHIPLSNLNKLCSCGKRGCLEVEASLTAALAYANERLDNGENSSLQSMNELKDFSHGDFLLKAAIAGDQLAISALNKSAYMIGKGIATLIHILNPEKIIISGRGAIAGPIILPTIQSAIHEFCIPQLAQHTKIKISTLNIHAQLLGSTCLVVENSHFPNLQHKQTIKTHI